MSVFFKNTTLVGAPVVSKKRRRHGDYCAGLDLHKWSVEAKVINGQVNVGGVGRKLNPATNMWQPV